MYIILGGTLCMFTATTVFADALLGGVTFHSAAFVHQNKKRFPWDDENVGPSENADNLWHFDFNQRSNGQVEYLTQSCTTNEVEVKYKIANTEIGVMKILY